MNTNYMELKLVLRIGEILLVSTGDIKTLNVSWNNDLANVQTRLVY